MKNEAVGVVIPSYNGGEDIKLCLKALMLSTYPDLKILIVDNASIDGSLDKISEEFPKVSIKRLLKNTGYAGACNIGSETLMAEGKEFIALVNQDVVVEADWLESIIECMQLNTDVAAAQSLVLLAEDHSVVNSVGNHIHYLGFGYAGGNGQALGDTRLQKFLRGPTEVAYASGATLVIRARHIKELGLFQDSFFMYHEDLDFGWRVRLAGYKSVLVPASKVYHRYDFHRSSLIKYEYGERNRLLVILENYHFFTLMLIFPAWIVMEAGVVATSIIRGWFWQKIRGYNYILKNLPGIMEVRRNHQRLRRKSDRSVTALFAGKILYQDNGPFLLGLVNPFLAAWWAVVRRLILW